MSANCCMLKASNGILCHQVVMVMRLLSTMVYLMVNVHEEER